MKQNTLRDTLLYQNKNGYDRLTDEDRENMERYCRDYKKFLDESKTERECVRSAVRLAEARGFRPWAPELTAKPGDKIYYVNRDKAIMLAVIGTESLSAGANIVVAHTDAPRLDLKPAPLYEDGEMAYLRTHYYGGILKYQWVAVPLVLHGVVIRKDGTRVDIALGDREDEPQFIITDLLPHLGKELGKKPLYEGVSAEKLNLLVGGRPLADDEGKDRVKVEVLRLLYEAYGITEEDFFSAELQAVPAAAARDVGFDRSFIAAYGHDDGCAPMRALPPSWIWKRPDAPPCAFSRTRRKSAPRALRACSPPPLTGSWAPCAAARTSFLRTAAPPPSACPAT